MWSDNKIPHSLIRIWKKPCLLIVIMHMDLMNIVKIRSIKIGAHWTNRSIDQIIDFQKLFIDNVSGHMHGIRLI
jgi:hypothetical protein